MDLRDLRRQVHSRPHRRGSGDFVLIIMGMSATGTKQPAIEISEGKRFDLGLYESGATQSVKFDRPGVCYIFCNIHPEMSAVVVVLSTRFFGVSNRTGTVAILNIPPGRYRLGVWHERCAPAALKELPREVTVSEADNSLGTIELVESGDLIPSHKNKYGRDYDKPSPASLLYEER